MARDWLKIAADAYSSSTTYVDANYRKKWEDAINMFNSKHPAESKYHSDAYKHRSKYFRPKSRSMVRKHEAAAAAAFFSNVDVISTDAVDQGNKEQVASAAIWKEVLNHRLTKTIPWFQIVVGGVQDAMTVGVVCSYQYWKYRDELVNDDEYHVELDEYGTEILVKNQPSRNVLEDEPCVELQAIENIRIDPGADWINPIKSSPYVIRMIPMYVTDVKSLMEREDEKTQQPKWKKLDDAEIRSASKQLNDTTRQTRELGRQDSKDQNVAPLTDFEIVWVHENFVRLDGKTVVYYTLGTEHMLTEPKPLKEVYFHGEIPIVMGCAVIETHKIYPNSPVMMGEQLQREANEIANQRSDNVKLVLNKRYIVKRGAQVDLKSLVRNVPASITMANDVVGDVREIDFDDVTSSSYAEQDRLNVDYDELTGNFSQGSVMTNRKMGETVGGLGLISGAANQLTEYTIRTITETWIEKVLAQLVKLEQAYETDETILAIAADRAKLIQRYGINEITDSLLNHELSLSVNVGMGATDPNQKLGKFIGAMKAYGEVASMQVQNIDMEEAGKEVFGLAGYRDGRRFLKEQQEGQQVQQLQQELAQAHQALEQIMQGKGQLQQQQKQVEEGTKAVEDKAIELKYAEQLFNERLKAQDAIDKAQAVVEKANVESVVNDAIDTMKNLVAENEREMKSMMDALTVNDETDPQESEHKQAVQSELQVMHDNTMNLMAGIAQALTALAQPKTKTIQMTAPSGQVYEGVVTE